MLLPVYHISASYARLFCCCMLQFRGQVTIPQRIQWTISLPRSLLVRIEFFAQTPTVTRLHLATLFIELRMNRHLSCMTRWFAKTIFCDLSIESLVAHQKRKEKKTGFKARSGIRGNFSTANNS